MSEEDLKWVFNPKLTMLHIANSVQAKSLFYHPIVLGQVEPVTRITAKIMR